MLIDISSYLFNLSSTKDEDNAWQKIFTLNMIEIFEEVLVFSLLLAVHFFAIAHSIGYLFL